MVKTFKKLPNESVVVKMRKMEWTKKLVVAALVCGTATASLDARAALKKDEPKSVDLTSIILNKVFTSIGRPNFKARLDFSMGSKGMSIKDLSGKVQLPFRKAIRDIPLTPADPSAGNGELGQVLPYLDLETENLVVQWTVDAVPSQSGHKTLVNTIEFLNRKGQHAALVAKANSEVTDYVEITLYRIQFDFAGIEQDVGKVTVDGTCSASQSDYDVFRDGVIGTTPVTCKFSGYVYKEKDEYNFNLIYDSKNDSNSSVE